jgi:hypothetical protein
MSLITDVGLLAAVSAIASGAISLRTAVCSQSPDRHERSQSDQPANVASYRSVIVKSLKSVCHDG